MTSPIRGTVLAPSEQLYLDLLKRLLTRSGFEEWTAVSSSLPDPSLNVVMNEWLDANGFEVRKKSVVDASLRDEGRDWPAEAETMVGLRRLENLQECLVTAIADGVSGDILEAGVWRGGASIFMRGVLRVLGDSSRVVWVADSFQGLPPPDKEHYPADDGDEHWKFSELSIGVDEVRRNFERYGLLDEQVRFLPGWFKRTLPDAPITCLALLRLDGDMYQSTMETLVALYEKVSPGGFVVVDDYGAVPACRRATDDFRVSRQITEPLNKIDWTGVFWRRLA